MQLLIRLQELDQAIAKITATKKKLAAAAKEAESAAESKKQELGNRRTDSKSFRAAVQTREAELKANEDKIRRLQGQLNMVKTNKEYTAIQHEIAGLKADASRIEDDILQMLEQMEADETKLKNLAAEAEEMAKAAEERQRVVGVALDDADARGRRLDEERAELAAQIPKKYLSPYERLRRKGDGKPMAACRSFVCEGCRMALTANTVNRLMAGNELIYCHSCGRILYIADDEDIHGGIGAGRT